MNSQVDITKFWDSIPPGHRGSYPASDIGYQTDRAVKCFGLQKLKIKTLLDWGIGVGDLSRILQKKFSWKVYACDVSEKSLRSASKKVILSGKYLIPNNLDNFSLELKNIDAVFCHAVVWHMSSLKYFKRVVEIWASTNCKYIMFNAKIGEDPRTNTSNYKKNYVNALILNESQILKILKHYGYKLYKKLDGTREKSTSKQVFFTFKKV